MRTCRQFEESISLSASGCLPETERRPLDRHLAVCPDCRERHDQLAGLVGGLMSAAVAPTIEPPADFHARVVAAITGPEQRQPGRIVFCRPGWWLKAAASLAIGLMAWNVARNGSSVRPGGPDLETQPPTLFVYERTAAQSEEAFDALLNRHAATLSLHGHGHSMSPAFSWQNLKLTSIDDNP